MSDKKYKSLLKDQKDLLKGYKNKLADKQSIRLYSAYFLKKWNCESEEEFFCLRGNKWLTK